MKIAVSGKGGVGKTTFAAFLIRALANEGTKVLAIDADPDANLAQALGVDKSDEIVPISEMKALIEERTEAKVKEYMEYEELFAQFAFPALLLILVGFVLENTRFRKIP